MIRRLCLIAMVLAASPLGALDAQERVPAPHLPSRGEYLASRPRGGPRNAQPVDVTPKDFQPGDYLPFGARWLAYGGKVYTLYFEAEDERYPSYLGYIDASNTEHLVCDFGHGEHETCRPLRDADAGPCRAVAQGIVSY